MKLGLRQQFLHWLSYTVCKTKPGEKHNKFVEFFHIILFPMWAFYERQSRTRWDPCTGNYYVNGVEITSVDLMQIEDRNKNNITPKFKVGDDVIVHNLLVTKITKVEREPDYIKYWFKDKYGLPVFLDERRHSDIFLEIRKKEE